MTRPAIAASSAHVDPLFLRVYLRLVAALIGSGVLFTLLVVPKVQSNVARNVEATVGAALGVIAEALARDAQRLGPDEEPAAVDVLRKRFACPAAILERVALDVEPEVMARIDAGETVATGPEFRWTFLTRLPGTDRVLGVGPIHAAHPAAGGPGIAIIVLLLAALSMGAYLALSPIRRRLRALARTADAFGGGKLEARAEDREADTIGRLAAAFNRMAGEIQRLIAAQQELLRTVSHELRTPIQRIHFALELAHGSPNAEERAQANARVEGALDDLDRLIHELLTYVRLREGPAAAREPSDVARLVEAVVVTLRELGGAVNLELAARAEAPLTAHVDERSLERAVSNLVTNALGHAKSRAEVSVSRSEAGEVVIDVDDDGPGIPEEARLSVFEPFQRLDRAGERKGFGLGLAIARRVAELHGGTIEALSSPLGGARLRITLPAD